MEEIVKDAYGWLAREYHEGDQIYLFGSFGPSSQFSQLTTVAQVSLGGRTKCGCLRG